MLPAWAVFFALAAEMSLWVVPSEGGLTVPSCDGQEEERMLAQA